MVKFVPTKPSELLVAPDGKTRKFLVCPMMEISDEENTQDEGRCTQDEEKCINEMVKAILILDHSKKPFKQTDITKYMSQKPNRKQWKTALETCKNKLTKIGLTLMECKNSNPKSFFLVSNRFPLASMFRHADESELADRTLLILVLTFIFMKEGPVTDVDVLNHLQQLNIYSEQQTVHPYFGDIKKKILNDFMNQLYLEKIVTKDSETAELRWGERACVEVSKLSVLKFVCEIGYEGTIQPKDLASHYQIALEEEKAISCDEVMEVEE